VRTILFGILRTRYNSLLPLNWDDDAHYRGELKELDEIFGLPR
jgi:hypothetical protein